MLIQEALGDAALQDRGLGTQGPLLGLPRLLGCGAGSGFFSTCADKNVRSQTCGSWCVEGTGEQGESLLPLPMVQKRKARP